MEFVNEVLDFLQTGFASINKMQGLIIAAVAAFVMPSWRRLLYVAAGAVIVHVVIDTLLPVLARNAAFRLPELLEPSYWRYLGLLFVGYVCVVAVFFAVKRVVLKR